MGLPLSKLTPYSCRGYLLFLLLLWGINLFVGDSWWPATFILFSPRWCASLPLLLLVPLALWHSRYSLFLLLAVGAIVLGPFMGFNLPLGQTARSGGPVLRLLTCNIDSGRFNAPALCSLIRDSRADIVALQECPRDINLLLKLSASWYFIQNGELALFSKYPLMDPVTLQAFHHPHQWPRTSLLQCVVRTPAGDLALNTVHLPSPRYGLETVLDRNTLLSFSRKRLLIEETAKRWQTSREIQRLVAGSPLPCIVAGDFNMPVQSSIYRSVWGAYDNAFSLVGWGYGWTQRSFVRGIPIPVRIDQVLLAGGLVARVCATAADIGSDHLPLLADISR